MFDLEQAIHQWKQEFAAALKSPEAIDELESHLREELERRLQSGQSPQQAFRDAVREIGEIDMLKSEFAKNRGLHEFLAQIKRVALTLAGIPDSTLATNMNTSQSTPEPRWATYFKGAAFVLPALFLWTLSAVFIIPKLQQIARDAGLPTSTAPGASDIWNLMRHTVGLTLFLSDHVLLIAGAAIGLFILLEWRSAKWPRYRRATVGTGVFLLNSLVLVSIFIMLLVAIVIAPGLAPRGPNVTP
jgi:hypothetical protein